MKGRGGSGGRSRRSQPPCTQQGDDRLESLVAQVGGADIRYFTGGRGEPLLIVHGCGEGAMPWLETARELSRSYRVYVPDLPGFGNSQEMRKVRHYSQYPAFIEGFLDKLGVERVHLVGHSMGGLIALLFALNFPDRTERLTLVSSIGLGREIALWVRFLASPPMRWTFGEIAMATLEGIEQMTRLLRTPFRYENPIPRIKADMSAGTITLRGQSDILLGHLSELVVPTTLVWGDEDSIVPATQASKAAQLIPNCRVYIFSGAGHSPYRDKTREFCHLLTRSLEQVSTTTGVVRGAPVRAS